MEEKDKELKEKQECCCEEDHGHHHDHEHEHHHDHEHGHEHHHDHDHEHHHHHHDEDCGCECHEHEHHHHDHDHGHHHHDDECECDDPNCTDPSHHHHHHHEGPVSISHHETSVIGAVKGIMKEKDFEKAEAALAEQMKECGRLVTDAGGIIGHIKFVLSGPGKCSQISVTDVDENIRRFDGTDSTLEGVAIVFMVEDEALTDILNKTICSLIEVQ